MSYDANQEYIMNASTKQEGVETGEVRETGQFASVNRSTAISVSG